MTEANQNPTIETNAANSAVNSATNTVVNPTVPAGPAVHPAAPRSTEGRPPRSHNPRRLSRHEQKERIKPEFDSKIITIRRVTRVTSGGRRMAFSVAVVAGDRKGRVGVGLGKANDTSLAIDKATRDAKKHMIKVATTKSMSIPHPVEAKYSSATVMLMPVAGRGLVAGSSIRTVLELAGVTDVVAKLLSGSKNKINIARVGVYALSKLSKVPRKKLEIK